MYLNIIGRFSGKKQATRISHYYMPVNEPAGYKVHLISVSQDLFYCTYTKEDEKSDAYEDFEFGCYYENSGENLENVIEEDSLVQSEYSDELYFYYDKNLARYSVALFEIDDQVCYMRFPYEISLDDEKQVKLIEEMCQMEKKTLQ